MRIGKKTTYSIMVFFLSVVFTFLVSTLPANAATFSYKGVSYDTSSAIKKEKGGLGFYKFHLADASDLIYICGEQSGNTFEYVNDIYGDLFDDLQNVQIYFDCKLKGKVTGEYDEYSASFPFLIRDIVFGENFSSTDVTDMSSFFYGEEVYYYDGEFSSENGCMGLTYLDLSRLDTSNVINMSCMFGGCRYLTNLDVSMLNTDKVIDMSGMFAGCRNLTNLDVSMLNTDKVTNMAGMFRYCINLTNLNVSMFNTVNVTDIRYMFQNCSSLTELDLSNINTSKVTSMLGVFMDCSNLINLNISKWNTEKVTDMSYMFYGCSSLTELNLCSFNTTNTKQIYYMFWNCSSLKNLDLKNFNTANMQLMFKLFDGCTSLEKLNLSNWVITYNPIYLKYLEFSLESCTSIKEITLKNFNSPVTLKIPYVMYDVEGNKSYTTIGEGKYDCILDKDNVCRHRSKVKTTKASNLKSAATCTSPAVYYYECGTCHTRLNDTFSYGSKAEHTKSTKIIPAEVSKDGTKEGLTIISCSKCKVTINVLAIPKIYISVAETAKYTGGAIKQPVSIVYADGKAISKEYYDLSYKNNKKTGKASVTIKFKGKYKGSVTKNFYIVKKDVIPSKVKNVKLVSGKKAFTVKWKCGSKNTDGYEIQYSTDKNFISGVKSLKVNKITTVSKEVKNLKSKTEYYVRIRAYNKEGKTTAYSTWYTVKTTVKTK